MSRVIGTLGDNVTPVLTMLANGLVNPKFTKPMSTVGLGSQIARYVRIFGRHHKLSGGDGTSKVTLRVCLNDTGGQPADAAAVGNSLHLKQTYNTANANFVDLATGIPETQKVVSNATNATPIVVTTGAHGYSTGDLVEIAAVVGNTAANGTWRVTVLSATTFSLDTSVGNGAYVSGGTADRHMPFSLIAHMNSQDAAAGYPVPIPSEYITARFSNGGTAYGAGGSVYVDRMEILD